MSDTTDALFDDPTSRGRAKAGKARMAALTPEERTELAKSGAQMRWATRWTGPAAVESLTDIKDIVLFDGQVRLACAVLSGEVRVLTQNSFLRALGRTGRPQKGMGREEAGVMMPPFLQAQNIQPYLTEEVMELCTPIPFRTSNGQYAWGYKAELLPMVCEVYLKADDAGDVLTPKQKPLAKTCSVLIRGLARLGIIALVDEATGYQNERVRDALSKILEAWIAKELQPYVRTFPIEYYENLFRLRGLPFSESSVKRPSYFGCLTNDIIYSRLETGVLEELKKVIPRNDKGRPTAKYFRMLTTNLGYPKLREHLGGVVTLMRLSQNYPEFRSKLDEMFPRGGQLTFKFQYDQREDSGQGI